MLIGDSLTVVTPLVNVVLSSGDEVTATVDDDDTDVSAVFAVAL